MCNKDSGLLGPMGSSSHICLGTPLLFNSLLLRGPSMTVQAFLPVIREMGTPRGHLRQGSLKTRLALIAAAPWKTSPGTAQV